MYRGWEIIRGIAAAVGIMMILLGVGTSDYYVMELGQHEPVSVWPTIVIGFALVLPAGIHAAVEEYKYWK